jgi:hypothetical protein
MTDIEIRLSAMRAGLIEELQLTRAVEREIFAALDPIARDRVPSDGEWSAKDTLAHLSAWRQRETDKLVARREGRVEPKLPATDIDEMNAIFHDQRAGWTWERVAIDAESTADGLLAEVGAASDEVLGDPKVVGGILGDGLEHDLGHLARLATSEALRSRVVELAETARAIVDRGGWPARAAAYARYNLACFHALGGRLDTARALLREALPAQEELRAFAPEDDDLISLRAEIPALAAG